MTDNTKIEWTHRPGTIGETWNVLRGCSRVSDGCKNCYAETQAARWTGPGQPYEGLIAKGGQWNGNVKFVEHKLTEPLRWKKPRTIFVNSMSDLFHENVPDEWIDRIFAVMAMAPQHTFQILTKRPARMLYYMDSLTPARLFCAAGKEEGLLIIEPFVGVAWPFPNVWLGVSVENQATADERIPLLLQTPAAVRWLSCEPLLGPIELHEAVIGDGVCRHEDSYLEPDTNALVCARCEDGDDVERIDWVVVGGESGSGARPMHPDWARSLRDQCAYAGVPFFFKQWGEWSPAAPKDEVRRYRFDDMASYLHNVGKKKAGSLLDGAEHREWPQ